MAGVYASFISLSMTSVEPHGQSLIRLDDK